MSEAQIVILFFSVLAACFVWGIVFKIKNQRRQKQGIADLREQAKQLGLQFTEKPDGEAYHRFDKFMLFKRGRKPRVSNLIEGDSGDVKISIFDYRYKFGKHPYRQTVIALQSEQLRLPEFWMRPEMLLDKIGDTLGLQDFDFDSHPEFSKLFVLKGSDEAAIRHYFTPKLLEFFERHPNNSLEANNDTMFFYRERELRKPEELKDLLTLAYEAFNVLAESNVECELTA